ncbi:MAG TPA: alpha/beta hydrolase [Bacteroidota bacterium]|nr:alpha/beta hydrolase [Bacteroidota bacterium]
MATTEPAITAARNAERELWQEYGLTVVERFIGIDEPRLRVRMLECGDPTGEPLIFVQGGLGEALGWAGLMARLTEFRCITLDRPGGGLSDGVDFLQVDMRKLAVKVLEAVLDSAGLRQAAFVANSMGGWWTFQLAMAAPERVSRMVMIGCPAVILNTSAPLPMRLMSLPVLGRALVKLMSPASPTKARDVPQILGHPSEVGQRWSQAEAEAWYRFGNLPNVQRSWSTLLRRFLTLTGSSREVSITEGELRGVMQPTPYIWGKNDPFGSLDAGRTATEIMPSARLEVVGIGHLPWWDDAEKCASLVREFVASSSGTTAG